MATLTTRAGKGSALTHNEMDANFNNLNTELTSAIPVTTRTTSGTLVVGEANGIVEMNSGSALTITVPPNSAVAFPLQTIIEIAQIGAGAVTIAGGSGVTLRGGTLTTTGQWESLMLRKRATDEWVVQ